MIHLKFSVKFLLLSAAIVLLASCGTSKLLLKSVPVEIQTGAHQTVTTMEPVQTGKRDDVPVGWKPKDTIVVHQTGGAETYVNTHTGQVAQNAAAQSITQAINKPKKSWAWLYWLLGIMGLAAGGNYLLKSYVGVNPFGWIGGKIFKK